MSRKEEEGEEEEESDVSEGNPSQVANWQKYNKTGKAHPGTSHVGCL